MRCRSFSIYRKTNQRQLLHLQMPFYRQAHCRIHIWQYVRYGYFLYLTIAASLICPRFSLVFSLARRYRENGYHIGVPFSKCRQKRSETSRKNTNFNKTLLFDYHCRFKSVAKGKTINVLERKHDLWKWADNVNVTPPSSNANNRAKHQRLVNLELCVVCLAGIFVCLYGLIRILDGSRNVPALQFIYRTFSSFGLNMRLVGSLRPYTFEAVNSTIQFEKYLEATTQNI